jgi:23S rRNA (adenine2503-C2)-methyltransferase
LREEYKHSVPIQKDYRTVPRLIDTSGKKNLIGLPREQLKQCLRDVGIPEKQLNMRSQQLWSWFYQKGHTSFATMTNMSKSVSDLLADHFTLERPEIVSRQISVDGTRKYLIKLSGGHEVEMVYIPEADRGTLCVSSQVGCTLTCTFCHTGTQKLVRNLTAGEIVSQVLLCRDDLQEWPHHDTQNSSGKRLLSNIVFMGMGEPLYNFDNVRDAAKIMTDGEGLSLSRRRVTLSTSGVVPEIYKAGEEIGCMLAISLHATTDDVRNTLVPINKKWNIETLLDACRNYPRASNAERITFEYVMLKGINDSDEDAYRLIELLKGIPAKVNLIPFNPWPNAPYECSSNRRIQTFGDIINAAGYASPVRAPRGRDILAACGQLKSETEKIRASAQR